MTAQHAFLGTCSDCGSRMVEYARTAGEEMRTVQLECENDGCDAIGRLRHAFGTDPLNNPAVQEGVDELRSAMVHWHDCPRCDGHGWVESGIGDLERAMGGRDTPCPRCHTSGAVLGEVVSGDD